jgi:hypothetical protein
MKQLQQFPTTYTSRSERERKIEPKSIKKKSPLPMEEAICICIVSGNLLQDVFSGIVFSSTTLPLVTLVTVYSVSLGKGGMYGRPNIA